MEAKTFKLEKMTFSSFQKNINEMSISTLKKLKRYLDDIYYNTGDSVLEDEKYDYIKETLMEKEPGYKPEVGAKLREGENRSKLPVWLGSMDKIKPEDTRELAKWLVLNRSKEYVISDKLDGVSALLVVEDGEYHLYTRGDGIVGADISAIIPYLNFIPQNLENIIVRGELIITVKAFENHYRDFYKNPRNMVSGITGAKTARKGLSDVDFVSYEIIYETEAPKPETQLKELAMHGFRVARHTILESLTVENLIVTLLEFKDNSPYEIDGLIVQANKPYIRNTEGNPEYAFAFKMRLGENIAQTEVKEVIWNISKRGMLKPRIRLEPVELGGVTIEYATGFNAKFIEDNVIGPGAIVEITRSGDVIPYIVSVISSAGEPEMPDIPYVWNKSRVDIFAEEGGQTMCIKIMNHFFNTLGVKHVAVQTLNKIYESGADTLVKLLSLKKKDLVKIEGIQEKSAERIYTNIHEALQNVPLYRLMAASSIFGIGIGVKKLKALTQSFPEIMKDYKEMSREELYEKINAIEGFSDITTNKIIANLIWFDRFLREVGKWVTLETKTKTKKSQSLEGMKFVFSGIRNKELEEKIENLGGAVTTSVSSKTTGVITNDKSQTTGKIGKARNLGVPVMTIEEFTKKYL